MQRYNSSTKASNVIVNGRTRPLFFQRALDLVPGKPFVLNIERWLEIQRCGLFRNLTAKTTTDNDNVILEINGIENPSLSISPELGVSLSFVRPEVSGGIAVTDKNFRGLGENFQLVIAKAEGIEKGVSDLPPNLKVVWRENSIGKTSTLSAGIEDFSSMQYFKNLVPSCVQKLNVFDYCSSFFRIATQSSKIYLQRDGYMTVDKVANTESLESNSMQIPKRLDYSIQGFVGQLHRDQLPLPIQTFIPIEEEEIIQKEEDNVIKNRFLNCNRMLMGGLKSILQFTHQSGSTLRASHEGGLLSIVDEEGRYPFHQIGLKVDFNPIELKIADQFDSLTSILKVSLNSMRSWGTGCLPIHHHRCLNDPLVVRSFVGSAMHDHNHAIGHDSFKSDLYWNQLLSFGSLGLFFDATSYIDSIDSSSGISNTAIGWHPHRRSFVSAGISLRSQGFRVDVGTPLLGRKVSRIQFSLDVEG
eukprot:CAMPEP_0170079170 /NCGR_PEP_ID=MMETSP0019_2-20121128/15624_1 /TAXON_ID=98059 /ORGANISM="Dinobryon sp., Strain UTEXLB2267" /LENGTH=471 /DNA_ID=CAMNT_0010292505 /DNA_START=69 /DNA_END=1484 /DNA_ORIENTATION=+